MSEGATQEAGLLEVTHHPHGAFSWADLATTDPTAAKRFYTALFGWTFEDAPAGSRSPSIAQAWTALPPV